jgi:hypothetical protein
MDRISYLALAFTLPAFVAAQTVEFGDQAKLNYQGYVGLAQFAYPLEGSAEQSRFQTQWLADLDLTLSFAPKLPVELRIHPRMNYDYDRDGVPGDGDRHPVRFDDLYLDFFTRWFELRAGYQIFSWKVVESYSQADVLNQVDREEDFLDPPKVGEPSVRARFILPTTTQNVLELYYLPWFTPAHLPGPENRFFFFTNQPIQLVRDQDAFAYGSRDGRWRPQWAARWQTQLFEAFDVAAYYVHGYRRFPLFRPVKPPDAPGLILTHYYPAQFQGGFTFQGALGNWLWKGETAFLNFEEDLLAENGNQVDPYFTYTAGLEYTFYSPIIQNHDIGAILEFIGDSDAGKEGYELEGFRPFRSYAFAGLRYVFNTVGDRSLLVGTFVDYLQGDFIYRAEYAERLFGRLAFKAEIAGMRAETGSPFKPFEKAGRAAAELKLHF